MYFIRISASSFYKQIQKITRKTDITYIPLYIYITLIAVARICLKIVIKLLIIGSSGEENKNEKN